MTAPTTGPRTDPRPQVVDADDGPAVAGVRCTACGHPSAFPRPRCPACRGPVVPALFGPTGRVWSSTVVRIPVPGRTPPYALAYVDLDDGPRVLAGAEGDAALAMGTPVRLLPADPAGDVRVAVAR